MGRIFSIILVLLLVLTVLALGFTAFGYTQLKTSLSIQKLEPQIGLDVGSLATAAIDLFSGNWSGALSAAISGVVKGLSFEGAINIHNQLPIPLYVPDMKHSISINDYKCPEVIPTNGGWIAPFGDISWPCSLLIETKDLSPLVLNVIGKGGNMEVVIVSEMNLGGVTVNKSTTKQYTLESLLSRLSRGSSGTAQAITPNVSFMGWYTGGANVTSITKGNTVTARITLSGGTAGPYSLQVGRDISLASDVVEFHNDFQYDGNSASIEISFTASYATGESRTRGYWLALAKDGKQIWTIPNNYPPRLQVVATSTAASATVPLSVNFVGWYTGGANVTSITKGNTITARITISGGTAGQCSLQIGRDISIASDTVVSQNDFQYNGNSGSSEISFTPSYATGEAQTRGYWLALVKDGKKVWSIPDSYPPRLQVLAASTTPPTAGPLSVSFVGWYVGGASVTSTNKGNTVTARITISGGTAGQYSLQVGRDISLASDVVQARSDFYHDGNASTREVQFIPPYATGESGTRGYWIALTKDGKQIWTIPDSYPPRLKVTSAK